MLEIHNTRDKLLAAAADILLRPVVFVIRRLRRQEPPDDIRKILLVRLDNIGDVVMLTPLIRELKTRVFPRARIDVLLQPGAAAILQGNPHVSRLLPFPAFWFARRPRLSDLRTAWNMLRRLRSEHYDLALEPRGDIRNILLLFLAGIPRRAAPNRSGGERMLTHVVPHVPGSHWIRQNLGMAEFFKPGPPADPYPEIFPGAEGRQEALAVLRELRKRSRPLVAVFPGSRSPGKEWGEEKYSDLCRRIATELNALPVLLGTAREEEVCRRIRAAAPTAVNYAGKLSLAGLIGFLEHCDAVVGNDSGPAHIAAALGRPVVALFGPIDPEQCRPYHRTSGALAVVYEKLPCSFCNRSKILPPACRRRKTVKCLEALPVERVFMQVRRMLR